MEIKVHTKNLHLTPRLETYIDKKVERLDRYLSNITEANLELRKEGRNEQPVAQLTIRHRNGTIFRAEDKKQQDIFAAIDEVVDKMYRQVERYKSKRRHKKGGDRWIDLDVAEDLALPIPEAEEEPIPETAFDEEEMLIVRRKDVLLNPMLEDEAMEQIDLLGHDFFVFLNGETGRVNVLYKREDGNYGLLATDR
ncbi:MAG: ribosome-associated translation inhibitor RaiA [Anaerolineales bacterium]|nr:ribosome-associated translation inhibitor RaiA [Anaerolineales bacterium]